jgi:hypothetical protein
LHSELTQTDPDGRIDGVRAPAPRAKTRGVMHDCGKPCAYDKKFKALVPQDRIRCKISLKGRSALHFLEVHANFNEGGPP